MLTLAILVVMILVLAVGGVLLLGAGVIGIIWSLGDVLFGFGILYFLFFRKKHKKNKEKEAKKSE